MSDLAEMGLLEQPHTSAGRVPSQKGYRVYIDRLMKKRPISGEEQRYIDSLLLPSAYDPEKLLDGVARALAGMTKFAAVSTTPSGNAADIRAASPQYRIAHSGLALQRAGSVGLVAYKLYQEGGRGDAYTLEPFYLRETQAERLYGAPEEHSFSGRNKD
jgi:hypothetical protein